MLEKTCRSGVLISHSGVSGFWRDDLHPTRPLQILL